MGNPLLRIVVYGLLLSGVLALMIPALFACVVLGLEFAGFIVICEENSPNRTVYDYFHGMSWERFKFGVFMALFFAFPAVIMELCGEKFHLLPIVAVSLVGFLIGESAADDSTP
ncbi:hypothetical protein HZC00_04780 [Candidatus Kaiserbacteria bacterium]|nr:hypothetical protein [Candidatus Kaiserbacteria bacterium]